MYKIVINQCPPRQDDDDNNNNKQRNCNNGNATSPLNIGLYLRLLYNVRHGIIYVMLWPKIHIRMKPFCPPLRKRERMFICVCVVNLWYLICVCVPIHNGNDTRCAQMAFGQILQCISSIQIFMRVLFRAFSIRVPDTHTAQGQ